MRIKAKNCCIYNSLPSNLTDGGVVSAICDDESIEKAVSFNSVWGRLTFRLFKFGSDVFGLIRYNLGDDFALIKKKELNEILKHRTMDKTLTYYLRHLD
jgi:hypothetical protein